MFDFLRRGSMLTGSEILKQVNKKKILITPFNENRINPNSYNLSLNPKLCVYSRGSDRSNIVPYTSTSQKLEGTTKEGKTETIMINNHECPEVTPYLAIDQIDDFARSIPVLESTKLKPIDSMAENAVIRFTIPESGFVLQPGVLYLGRTNEAIATNYYIPMINGRSSGGRLGLSVHICAGFGDIGFDGTFTLEISVVEPLIIYPNMEIAQVCFHTPHGKIDRLYHGKYSGQIDATPSRMWFENGVSGNSNVVTKVLGRDADGNPVAFTTSREEAFKNPPPKIPPMDNNEVKE